MPPLRLPKTAAVFAALAFALGLAAAPLSAAAFGTAPGIEGRQPSTGGPGGPDIHIPGGALAPTPSAPEDDPDAPTPGTPSVVGPAGLPKVHYDLAELPPPVAAMRRRIIEAARSGDPEALRPIIALSKPPPLFSSLGDGDPIDILKAGSGDEGGREILAILLDVLDAGWVVKDEGTPQARYIWPYFAEFPPDSLTPPQLVEVYRLLTSGDFEQMRGVGSYEFYRAEIGADGRWLLFMSGD